MSQDVSVDSRQLVDQRALSKLKWRCRRGLLENDLFIARFFARFQDSLTVEHAQALNRLMDLSDNDLLDLHLGRKSVADINASLDTPGVAQIVNMLRRKH